MTEEEIFETGKKYDGNIKEICYLITHLKKNIYSQHIEVKLRLKKNNRIASCVAIAYILDPKYSRPEVIIALKKGFNCCMCNRNFILDKDYDLRRMPQDLTQIYEGFNILCGFCWTGTKKMKDYKPDKSKPQTI